jgi:hypothetical protein
MKGQQSDEKHQMAEYKPTPRWPQGYCLDRLTRDSQTATSSALALCFLGA